MQSNALTTPNWAPLQNTVPSSWLPDFMHMGEHGSIQLYKRRGNRRYLNIDSDSLRFYQYRAGQYMEVSRTTAILDSLGIRNWDVPISAIAHSPARFRAASMLTAFFAFQRSLSNGSTEYSPGELAAVVSVLSRVGCGLENFAEMCTAEIENADCERSLKHEVGLLLTTIENISVPATWVPDEDQDTSSHSHAGRLWQEFCVRLAAEAVVEPVYGMPLAEPAMLPQRLLGSRDSDRPAEALKKSRWLACLLLLKSRGRR